MRRGLSALAPVAAWLGLIALWSSGVGAHDHITRWVIERLGGWFPGLWSDTAACAHLSNALWDLRKPAHLLEYAVLALLTYRAAAILTSASRRRLAVTAVVFCSLVGALDELHQSLDPIRTGLPTDALVDVLGAVLGLACGALVRRWRDTRRRSCSPSST